MQDWSKADGINIVEVKRDFFTQYGWEGGWEELQIVESKSRSPIRS